VVERERECGETNKNANAKMNVSEVSVVEGERKCGLTIKNANAKVNNASEVCVV
jgi:hypothetical protein